MSSVDADKFEQLVQSLSNRVSIFDAGGSAVGEGQLISAGMSQLSQLDEYYTIVGKNENEIESDEDGDNDSAPEEAAKDVVIAYKEQLKETTEILYEDVSDLATEYNLDDYVDLAMDQNYNYVQISLSGSFLFESGKADMKESALPIFSRVGDILKSYNDFIIEIEGHTDTVPIKNAAFENNYWLSAARALNAAEYLIDVKGLNPSTLKASGRGEYAPIASNKTEEGRRLNRRIEIKIYNSLIK